MPRLRALVAIAMLVALATAAASCGSSGPDRDPIRIQASNVDGQLLVVDDLGDRDTMLWFWAPW